MAFNPSPKVAVARHFADQFDADQVIIIALNRQKGTMEYASYGETKALCAGAKKLADVAYNAIYKELEK